MAESPPSQSGKPPDLFYHLLSGCWWPRLLPSEFQSHPRRYTFKVLKIFSNIPPKSFDITLNKVVYVPCQAGEWSWGLIWHQWQPAPAAGCLLWCWTRTTLPPTGQKEQLQVKNCSLRDNLIRFTLRKSGYFTVLKWEDQANCSGPEIYLTG